MQNNIRKLGIGLSTALGIGAAGLGFNEGIKFFELVHEGNKAEKIFLKQVSQLSEAQEHRVLIDAIALWEWMTGKEVDETKYIKDAKEFTNKETDTSGAKWLSQRRLDFTQFINEEEYIAHTTTQKYFYNSSIDSAIDDPLDLGLVFLKSLKSYEDKITSNSKLSELLNQQLKEADSYQRERYGVLIEYGIDPGKTVSERLIKDIESKNSQISQFEKKRSLLELSRSFTSLFDDIERKKTSNSKLALLHSPNLKND